MPRSNINISRVVVGNNHSVLVSWGDGAHVYIHVCRDTPSSLIRSETGLFQSISIYVYHLFQVSFRQRCAVATLDGFTTD